jgi:uncharacterized protein YcnI
VSAVSRVRRAVIAVAALVVAVGASPAAAHVTLAPPFVEAGEATTVSFATPNERAGRATTALEIVAPAGVELAASTAPAGWTLTLSDVRARWRGGRIEGQSTVSFPLEVTARTRAGTETFRATQTYDDGEVVHWDANLAVLPPSADAAPPQHLRRALVASAVGLIVIMGSFAGLRFLRLRSGGGDLT